ncbi:MAG: hypothetical protein R3284_11830, partial [Rubricoccaceae bacterium]|nr:hypothetical protein [Rubricoccaceae bacterium]
MADSPDTSQAFADTMLRLLQTGKQVVIDGVGRLSRVHRPARVEVKDDGTRVLLPPSAVVDFTQGVFPAESSSDIVLEELKTSAGVDAAADWMKALVSLRSSLDRGESAELPGIGQFSSKGSDITFEATETLTRSVNAAFAGLVPIGSWATPEPEVERTDDGTAEPEPVDEIEIDFSKPESDETDDTLNEPEEETQPSTEAVKLVSLAELSKKLELDEEKQADEAETGSVPWEFKDSNDADEETDSAFDEADKGGVLEPEALSDDESETEHDDVLDHEVDEEAEDTFEEDDDLEEIIAGVWTAGEAAESFDALGVETEQEPDEAEFAVVGADVAAGATLASTLTPLSDKELTDAQKPEPEFVPVDPQPESEQSRWP